MKYRSTRSSETVTALEALVKGLASDGGLYVPSELPAPFLAADDLMHLSYEELAAYVLSHFFTDIPEEDMKKLTHDAYTGTFETPEIVPVKTMSESFSMAEMFHGRTCAFKDLALSLFPYLLVYAKKQQKDGKEVLILTATSGDTGKAALEGFRDVPGVHIMVFYPSHGVSPLQQDQMQKQLGNNVKVVGIEGNFDDAQSTLKKSSAVRCVRDLQRRACFFQCELYQYRTPFPAGGVLCLDVALTFEAELHRAEGDLQCRRSDREFRKHPGGMDRQTDRYADRRAHLRLQ